MKRPAIVLSAAIVLLCILACCIWLGDGAADHSADASYGGTDGVQAVEFSGLSRRQAVRKIGKICREDMEQSGILASVSAAQFILESAYGTSELAQNANNCFGMKCLLSGNTWPGTVWDGTSIYTKETKEEYTAGELTIITADFRKYSCVEDSVRDHSAYLLGAMKEDGKRYEGLSGETDYRKAVQIIKDGGYATDSSYVELLCSVIERYNLTRYDVPAKEAWFSFGFFDRLPVSVCRCEPVRPAATDDADRTESIQKRTDYFSPFFIGYQYKTLTYTKH